MKIKLKSDLEFKKIKQDIVGNDNKFITLYMDYYHTGEMILCAIFSNHIVPLSKVDLRKYVPKVKGVWITEDIEYE